MNDGFEGRNPPVVAQACARGWGTVRTREMVAAGSAAAITGSRINAVSPALVQAVTAEGCMRKAEAALRLVCGEAGGETGTGWNMDGGALAASN